MKSEKLFDGEDLARIEALRLDPESKPGYCLIKGCLAWDDERPDGVTNEAWYTLCDLWIARSFLHRGKEIGGNMVDPDYYKNIWDKALEQNFSWPGFQRLTLNEEDKAYYETQMASTEDY